LDLEKIWALLVNKFVPLDQRTISKVRTCLKSIPRLYCL
jgi:hypothetical protein